MATGLSDPLSGSATASSQMADPLGTTMLSRADTMLSPSGGGAFNFGGGVTQSFGAPTSGPASMPFVTTTPGVTSALNYSGSSFLGGNLPPGTTAPQLTQFGNYSLAGGLPGGAGPATGQLTDAAGNAIGGGLSPGAANITNWLPTTRRPTHRPAAKIPTATTATLAAGVNVNSHSLIRKPSQSMGRRPIEISTAAASATPEVVKTLEPKPTCGSRNWMPRKVTFSAA